MSCCIYCNSNNIVNCKIAITKPVGAKKNKCNTCLKTFIVYPTNNLQKKEELIKEELDTNKSECV